MDKEKWIEEILQSAKAVQPVPSNAFMITRIEAKLQQPVVLNKITAAMGICFCRNIAGAAGNEHIHTSQSRTTKSGGCTAIDTGIWLGQ
ncbi:MAG: hypothetical protein WDO16_25125 [Bacteroidota bacterium]